MPSENENDQLYESAASGDESALAALFDLHRERLERIVRIRMDRRLQGRVDGCRGSSGGH